MGIVTVSESVSADLQHCFFSDRPQPEVGHQTVSIAWQLGPSGLKRSYCPKTFIFSNLETVIQL